MKLIRGLFRALGRRRWFASLGRRVLHHLDRGAFALTGHTLAEAVLPTLLLTTTGRGTGMTRRTPLLYGRDDGDYIVVGSSWGQRSHPGWSANLIADRRARITVDGHSIDVVARLSGGAERARLWSLMTRLWPPYEKYRVWASPREIRVFTLRPINDTDEPLVRGDFQGSR